MPNLPKKQKGRLLPLDQFLLPILCLVLWTLVIWLWMYATRIPAMMKAEIAPQEAANPRGNWRDRMPDNVNRVADNYNHLHEQPTTFYALMLTLGLIGATGPVAWSIAWAYVGFRVAHSMAQILANVVVLRFAIFVCSGLMLLALATYGLIFALAA